MAARSYSVLGLWPIVNRWKSLVLGALALALVVSTIVALLLPNVYKSTAVFYPTNAQTSDPDRIVEGEKLELSNRAEDLDRIITIGNSQPVAEYIMRKFALTKHYGIDADDPLAEQKTLEEFTSNLSLTRTERDAIELTFLATDKQMAANVANALVSVIDSFNQQLTVENRRLVLDLYRTRYQYLDKEYNATRGALVAGRRRYGIYGMDRESRYLAKEIVETETALRKAQGEGNASKAAGLRQALRALTTAEGGNLINLENYVAGTDSMATLYARFENVQKRLVEARAAFETADLALKGRISSLYLVQKAYPAARKAKPIRWLIVLSSVIITLGLSVAFITLVELYRRTKRTAQYA